MDALAREGALATSASVHVPLTRPSHISLFTGLYPAQHGIRDNLAPTLRESIPTLADALRAAHFRTAAFVSSIVLAAQSGLNRGFETYSARFDVGPDNARFLNSLQRRGDEVVDEAAGWLRSHSRERFAIWVHLYEPHDPYEPPEPYASRYAGRPYDGEVAWSDELVGRLDDALRSVGVRQETLTIVTSDHGEGLGEHGESAHGFFIYETTLRVPLIIAGPGIRPGSRIASTFRTVDILPSLLDLLAVPAPRNMQVSGRSLAGALRNGEAIPEAPSWAESLTPLLHYGWSDLRAVRDGRWKYILAPRPELYDLGKDPGETRNLALAEPARARALRTALERELAVEREARRASPVTATEVPADLMEKLGALGYVSPGGAAGAAAAGADPKDKIAEYSVVNRLMREALTALQRRDYSVCADRLRTLAGRGIDSFEVHYYLGRALAGLERPAEAAPHFERAIAKLPAFADAYLALADARVALRNSAGALDIVRAGRKVAPRNPELPEREAAIWRRMRRPDEAIRAYREAMQLAPRDGLLRVRLAELYRDLGDPSAATRLMREAVALEPDEASYWNSLGMLLGGGDDLKGAEAAFREAATRDPANSQYAYNLGLALLRQGQRDSATGYFERALEIDPRFSPARQRLSEIRSR